MTEQPKKAFRFTVWNGEGYVEQEVPKDLLSSAITVDFEGTSNEEMYQAVREAIGEHLGYGLVNSVGRQVPLHVLARIREPLQSEFDGYNVPGDVSQQLLAVVDQFIAEKRRQLKANLDRGVLEWDDIQFVFEKGREVVAVFQGELIGGYVESITRIANFMATYFEVRVRVISALGPRPEESFLKARVYYYDGLKKLNTLSVRDATADDKKTLAARGEVFRRATATGVAYLQYSGQVTRSGWNSDRSYRSVGRVMVDAGSFAQVDATQYQNENYQSGIEKQSSGRGETAVAQALVISDADLWRCMPFVYGFSFASKQWGRMSVRELTEIQWRDDAWDKLVLEPSLKELVRALVDNQAGTFDDIVEGKGGGTIFLLHGPPGQGKTLTAETIAERLHRPLYSVSVGELGVDPDQLEARLRVILDIATVWNAVILIDEADIFLEQRDEHNVVRNAMVGVFLRLLEYHQGVLFLTTNRVKTIDEAFYSRISVAIYFRDEGQAKREKVWTNLLDAAKIDGLVAADLAVNDLNGRQIKNVIRQAQTLARDRNEEVSSAIVKEVVALTAKFRADLEELKRPAEQPNKAVETPPVRQPVVQSREELLWLEE